MKLSGFADLDKALAELPRATAKNVLIRTLRKAGEPIAQAARDKVPIGPSRRRRVGKKKPGEKRGEGTFKWVEGGRLKASISVSTKTRNKVGKSEFAAAMRAGLGKAAAVSALRDARRAAGPASFAEMYVGATSLPHAHMVEFGTSRTAARPFMRPAWDSERHNALNIIKRELGAEIIMAAKRLSKSKRQSADVKYRASLAAMMAAEQGY